MVSFKVVVHYGGNQKSSPSRLASSRNIGWPADNGQLLKGVWHEILDLRFFS